ncbi:MAG TPA: metal ABC transporter permease [Methanospirillum sp.]|uniref:metal ABC transporter permease n=1 Tax=Methanospirillum sp. TaxID=45200 RepID=UPI002C975212|nr:metal ABC transporter permease [Methanospirillum sp.]HOJ95821.1 metal ABC transporter permease [Methanospirillum sp.]HOL41789.1 metal ABC transporter permease [Methanospirillum sp.]HPP76820.1 metal ABC transporter permease [Methanospirillum sp.]
MLEFLIPNNVMCHAVEAMLFASLGCALLSVLITQMNISSIGFTMSHAAFAGGSVGAFFGYAVLPSAVFVSILTAFLMGPLSDRTRMHTDTTLGVLFGTMMAVAIFFISLMQGTGKGFEASSLLYGNVISLFREEIYALALITSIIFMFLVIFYKEITAIIFHKRLAEIAGIRVKPVYYGILFLISVMVALSIPIVGGLLLYVWLVTPAAIAYQFCNTMRNMFIMAPVIAVIISLTGAVGGIVYALPVGPLTAVLFSLLFIGAVAISPKRRVIFHNH